MNNYITAQLFRSDLMTIDKEMLSKDMTHMRWVLLTKYSFTVLANLVDFERTLRAYYKEHPNLSSEYKRSAKAFEFAKYIRNVYVAHTAEDLVAKAIEWKPQLKYMLSRMSEGDTNYLTNVIVLETAINTYVDSSGKHRFFDSETDLVYPPDYKRFMVYLQTTVLAGISFLTLLIDTIEVSLDMPDPDDLDLNDFVAAGLTDFQYLKRKK